MYGLHVGIYVHMSRDMSLAVTIGTRDVINQSDYDDSTDCCCATASCNLIINIFLILVPHLAAPATVRLAVLDISDLKLLSIVTHSLHYISSCMAI